MSLLALYNKSIIRTSTTTNSLKYPTPTATVKSSPPLTDETMIKSLAKNYYENAPLLQTEYLGTAAQPLITIKPNETADQYSNKLNYTITRAKATTNWLLSPEGLKFSTNQIIGQALNPQIETKIWKPNSVFSNLIPLTGYHERRHQSLSSLFGIPIPSMLIGSSPANYTEALYSGQKHSRILYQSPAISFGDKEYVGIDYANVGRDIMTLSKTWKSLNPNRYEFPIGSDGGGMPNSTVPAPYDEMNVNIGLASQGWRYTQSTGINPILDSQITMNNQLSGTSYLQTLLKSVPYVNTLLTMFGYGILSANAQKIKIFNSYNPTFSYSKGGSTPNRIRVVNNDGELLDEYDIKNDTKTPLERILNAIETSTKYSPAEKIQVGITFANKADNPDFNKYVSPGADDRLLKNPYDGKENLNNYLQTYGEISTKRKAVDGTLNIDDPFENVKPYSKYMQEDVGARILHRPDGHGFAWSGAKRSADRQGDAINLLPYGEDSEGKPFKDLIPFKFYHVNTRKWIIFRANLTGLSDSITPQWNEKSYVGRSDSLYIYKNTSRKINFDFSLVVHNPKELQPMYEKLNYLIGLCYPVYRNLSGGVGQYMEAPFVKLTIGDLFKGVYGILDGGLTVTFDDGMPWEIRDKDPNGINIGKLPRLINVTVGGFTPFSLDNRPMSSTSPFYSAIKNWT